MGRTMPVKPVTDAAFKKYGRIISGLNLDSLLEKMEATPLPEGTVYVASDPLLESDREMCIRDSKSTCVRRQ